MGRSWRVLRGVACVVVWAAQAGCSTAPLDSQDGALRETESARAELVRDELQSWNAGLSDAVRLEKYQAMSASAFAFYRGSNHLFWADFADDERLAAYAAEGWIQGDLHVANFGAFHDDDGRIVYDSNDFDESVVADVQLDLWRCAVSLVLVSDQQDLSRSTAKTAVDDFVEYYLDTLESFRGNDGEQDYIITADNAYGRLDEFLDDVESHGSRQKMLGKWTVVQADGRQLDLANPDLDGVASDVDTALRASFLHYGTTLSGKLAWDADYFTIKSLAQRLHAGVGSLGSDRYYLLIEGPSASLDDDIILDVKQITAPTALSFMELAYPFDLHAQRAVVAQKALGVNVDDHLGWLELDGESFSVRERSPFKKAFDVDTLDSKTRIQKLAQQWGAILASDHARASQDIEQTVHQRTDGEHDEVRALVWQVAESYATQVAADYAAFMASMP